MEAQPNVPLGTCPAYAGRPLVAIAGCIHSRMEAAALLLNPENAAGKSMLGLAAERPEQVESGGTG
jgi:hypothetical protein